MFTTKNLFVGNVSSILFALFTSLKKNVSFYSFIAEIIGTYSFVQVVFSARISNISSFQMADIIYSIRSNIRFTRIHEKACTQWILSEFPYAFLLFFFHYFSRRSLFGLISLYVWKIIFVFFLSSTLNIFECCTQHLVYTDNCPNILFYRTVLPKQKKKNYICKT